MSTEQDRSPVSQRFQTSSAQPATHQAVKFLTAATISGALMLLSGLTVTFTVIALVVATPLMVIFSPVLIPAVLTLLTLAGGFLFSGACGASAVAALSWVYRYVKGKHPVGADQLDYARQKIAGAARDVTERVKEFGQ